MKNSKILKTKQTALFLALVGICISFGSCSKDEQTPETYEAQVDVGDGSGYVTFTDGFTRHINLPELNQTANPQLLFQIKKGGAVVASEIIGESPLLQEENTKGIYTYTVATAPDGGVYSCQFNLEVSNERELWAGTYTVRDSIIGQPAAVYTMQIAASATINNRLMLVGDFQQIAGNTGIYIDVTTPPNYQTISFPSQTFSTYTFSGSGAYTDGLSNFVLNYNDGTNNRAQVWKR